MRGDRQTAKPTTTDFAMPEAIFLMAYPGYTLDTIGEMDEEQYMSLARRIPHAWSSHPLSSLIKTISKVF